jgi:integrase
MRGSGRIFLRGQTYWIAYSLRGKEYRETTKTADQKAAEKFLKGRMREVAADQIGARTFVTPAASRLTIKELVTALEADFELRGIASAQNRSNLKRVTEDFGQVRATALTPEQIDKYIEGRLAEGDAKASINRTTQLLSQAYTLAIRRGHLSRAPFVRHLSEKGNARKGFFSEQEFYAVLAHLPEDLKDFTLYCYLTGSRKGEAARLTWGMLQGRNLQIPAEITKNDEARVIPLGPQLAEIIERRQAARPVEAGGVTHMAEFIFHRDGLPVRGIRKSWATACRKANCPGKLFHDLRRSCARRLIQAGVSQQTAKKLTGHRSNSMFERYAIVTDDDVLAAQQKAAEYREPIQQKVVGMP